MSAPSYDAVIVGAGIVGAACAFECAFAGLRVAVVESGPVAGGATAAGMGHIVAMDDSEAQFALTHFSQTLWKDLAGILPDNCEYLETGTLWIAADTEELEDVRRKYRYYSERGVSAEILNERELAGLEPNLRPGLAGALFVAGDAVVYPPCVTAFLLERARDRGAHLLVRCRVDRLDDSGVRLHDETVLCGDFLVNAAGSEAAKLTPQLSVLPRKGHLAITDRYPGSVHHQLVELGYLKSAHQTTSDSVAFNVQPRKTGQLLIGSSRQFSSVDSSIDSDILSRMLGRAVEYIPALAPLSAIRIWTGFRAATPDKLPLIGRVKDCRRVFAATGHEGLGITTSLATARLLVDEILGRKSEIARQPYQPTREMAAYA
ncbi:MAG: FAD-dependent oxidoreductase [Bryobacteraceae bacterium]